MPKPILRVKSAFFAEWGYPQAEAHARAHTQLLQFLKRVEDSITYGLESEWIRAGMQIKQALINHISKEDMQYMGFHRDPAH
jgi:hemerythrin